MKSPARLSTRELAVLRLLLSGLSLKEAATVLGLSITTVSTYKKRVMEKFGYKTNADLYRFAAERLDQENL